MTLQPSLFLRKENNTCLRAPLCDVEDHQPEAILVILEALELAGPQTYICHELQCTDQVHSPWAQSQRDHYKMI